MCARVSSLVLAGLLLLAGAACGGDDERFAIYHLELALGPPRAEGELHCGPPRTCPGVVTQPSPREVRYAVTGGPGLDADDIARDTARSFGRAVVVELTSDGREAFGRLTREVARYGARDQAWHHLAIVVGDEVIAFPEVDFDAYPNGIADAPSLQITAVSEADARDLAERLRG